MTQLDTQHDKRWTYAWQGRAYSESAVTHQHGFLCSHKRAYNMRVANNCLVLKHLYGFSKLLEVDLALGKIIDDRLLDMYCDYCCDRC